MQNIPCRIIHPNGVNNYYISDESRSIATCVTNEPLPTCGMSMSCSGFKKEGTCKINDKDLGVKCALELNQSVASSVPGTMAMLNDNVKQVGFIDINSVFNYLTEELNLGRSFQFPDEYELFYRMAQEKYPDKVRSSGLPPTRREFIDMMYKSADNNYYIYKKLPRDDVVQWQAYGSISNASLQAPPAAVSPPAPIPFNNNTVNVRSDPISQMPPIPQPPASRSSTLPSPTGSSTKPSPTSSNTQPSRPVPAPIPIILAPSPAPMNIRRASPAPAPAPAPSKKKSNFLTWLWITLLIIVSLTVLVGAMIFFHRITEQSPSGRFGGSTSTKIKIRK